jgi:hypothetical protein
MVGLAELIFPEGLQVVLVSSLCVLGQQNSDNIPSREGNDIIRLVSPRVRLESAK